MRADKPVRAAARSGADGPRRGSVAVTGRLGGCRPSARGRLWRRSARVGGRLGKRQQGEGVGEVGCRSPEPLANLLGALTRLSVASLCQECVESVTGMVHSASTSAPDPSPGVLSTLLVHNSTGLAIQRKIVVLRSIETALDRARSHPFPSAVYRAARHSEATSAKKAPAGRESTATKPGPPPSREARGTAPPARAG